MKDRKVPKILKTKLSEIETSIIKVCENFCIFEKIPGFLIREQEIPERFAGV